MCFKREDDMFTLSVWKIAACLSWSIWAVVAWIAPYYPPSQRAVVVFSRQESRHVGERVPLPEY